ncbi:hypothetical protein GCM10010207_56050 [Streptomyces atratus]|nr:hypothetical protein GCM10010207_56050 [Streptomyces atratus]
MPPAPSTSTEMPVTTRMPHRGRSFRFLDLRRGGTGRERGERGEGCGVGTGGTSAVQGGPFAQ